LAAETERMKVLLPAFGRPNRPKLASVGQDFHFHLQVALIARLAWGGLARRTVGARLETGVAQAVPAALGDHQLLARGDQVTDHFLGRGVDHGGADRHAQEQVLALLAGAIGAATVLAALGLVVAGIAIVDEGVEVLVGHHVHRAAVTAVAAVGATVLDEFLAAEAHATVAAVTGFYPDRYFVYKLHSKPPLVGRRVENQKTMRLLQK